jgi:hypothetical protein
MTKTFFLLLFLINLSLFPKEVKKDLPFDTFHKGVHESFQTQKEILFGFNAKRNSMRLLINFERENLLKLYIKEYTETDDGYTLLNTYFFKPSFSKKKKLKGWKCLYKNPDGESSLVYKKLSLSGMPKEIRYLDNDKKISNNKYGVAKEIYKQDRNGNEILREYQDEKGELVEQEGFARITSEYDKNGNRISEKLFGKDGKLKQDASGVSQRVWKYDSNGYLELAAEYNNKNEPLSKIIVTKRKYDNANRVIEESYFQDDKPTLNTEGIHKIKWTYDEKGNAIEEAYFNQENKESPLHGIIKYKWFYDDNNNRIKEEAFKLNQEKEIYNYEPIKEEEKQKPKLSLHLQIPSKEERIKLANKVIENTVTKDSKEFRVRSTYDNKGNLIQKEIIEGEGELYSVGYKQKRIMKVVWKYSKNGYPISEEYFDIENKQSEKFFESATKKWKFNKDGILKSYADYKLGGQLKSNRFIFKYDKKCIQFIKEKFKISFGEKVSNCLTEKIVYNTKNSVKYRLSRILIKNESSQNEIPFETILFNESRIYNYWDNKKHEDSFLKHGMFIRYSANPNKNFFIEFNNGDEPIYMGVEDKMKNLFSKEERDNYIEFPDYK